MLLKIAVTKNKDLCVGEVSMNVGEVSMNIGEVSMNISKVLHTNIWLKLIVLFL
jgi:hypothetical protein